MGTISHKLLCALVLTALSASSGHASPLNSKLLPLVPPGAGIVAGFENYPDPHHHGQLLLTTHNNHVDLKDWQSITGVDSERIVYEVIEAAATPSGGNLLTEHLLLVYGSFNQERIFASAESNGARRTDYEGQTVMVIEPFLRERAEMRDTRWLLILENRLGILGTPQMVQEALHRYRTNAETDMALRQRLSQLHSDLSAWNVLVSSNAGTKNIFMHSGSRWESLVDDAEILLVGARFGPTVRVDFMLTAGRDRGQEFYSQKADSFSQVFASVTSADSQERSPTKMSVGTDRVKGSIQLSRRQFALWGEQTKNSQNGTWALARALSRGE